jgi:CheY-like chemotaxis protein
MSSGRATLLVREGIDAARAGQTARARSLLRQALELDANNPAAWLWLAGVADHPKEAVQALEKSLRLNPDNPAAKSALAVARFEAGVAAAQADRRAEARQWLLQVCAENPANEASWLWLASVTDEPAEAIGYLERALKLNPANERARTGIEHFRALANPEWFCPICQARSKAKFTTCSSCGAVLDLARGDAAIGNPSPNVGKIQEGAARLAAENKAKPDFVGYYYLGMALLNLGKPEEAIGHFRSARTFRPSDEGLAAQVDLLERALNEVAPPTCRISTPESSLQPQAEKSILVIDASPIARKLVGMTVHKRGYKVLEAQDGREALEVIETHGRPDLIVMEAVIPGMDGYALCRAIRHNPVSAGVPVVVLSARSSILDKLRGKVAGADCYLAKPFEPADLIRVVHDYCPLDCSTVTVPRGCA